MHLSLLSLWISLSTTVTAYQLSCLFDAFAKRFECIFERGLIEALAVDNRVHGEIYLSPILLHGDGYAVGRTKLEQLKDMGLE